MLTETLGALVIITISVWALKGTQNHVHREVSQHVSDYLLNHTQDYYFVQMKEAVFADTSIDHFNLGIRVKLPSGVTRFMHQNHWNPVGLLDMGDVQSLVDSALNLELKPQVKLVQDPLGKRRILDMEYRFLNPELAHNFLQQGKRVAIKKEPNKYFKSNMQNSSPPQLAMSILKRNTH